MRVQCVHPRVRSLGVGMLAIFWLHKKHEMIPGKLKRTGLLGRMAGIDRNGRRRSEGAEGVVCLIDS